MEIADGILRNQVQFQRIVTKLMNEEMNPVMRANYLEIRRILLDAGEIRNQTQLNKILKKINSIVGDSMLAAWGNVQDEFSNMATYEAAFVAGLIADQVGKKLTVSENIAKYVNQSLMSLGGDNPVTGTFKEIYQKNVSGQIEVINNQIKASYVNGETINQTVTRIKNVTEGLLTNRVDALARTGINHYATQARLAMFKDNTDVIEREVPLVTFDNRISMTCASIGEKYGVKGWPVGESPIGYPSYHYNCRTTIAPLVKGQKRIDGTMQSVGGKEGDFSPDATYKGKKSLDQFTPKQIPTDTNFNSWLKRQPNWFQESVLGKTRAKAFRDGVDLEKFTDMTGAPLTLEELKNQNIIK